MIIPWREVAIGDVTITGKRGGTLIEMQGECPHKRLQAAEDGEILTCLDCDRQVSAWWALMRFARQVDKWKESIESRAKEIEDASKRTVVLRAALKVEEAWRRRKFKPCCPHCHKPIGPEDGFGREQMRIVSRNVVCGKRGEQADGQ